MKDIESKYQEMDEVTHIRARSGMYVGSTKEELKDMFIYDRETCKMVSKEMEYVPAMLKIVDEVISNSCDEYRRKDNLGMTSIVVDIDTEKNIIVVKDNGGIPVVKHPTADIYIPEFIFGRLRTSSNYNDDEDRNVIGTNGIGVKIANIFSTWFEIETCDKKNKFRRSWSDGMNINDDLYVEKTKDHYTKTSFSLDLPLLNSTSITDQFLDIIHKRCIDAAAANPGLSVTFIDHKHNDETWKFASFADYITLYSELLVDTENCISFKNTFGEFYIYPDSNIDVAFVNGAECSKGTHIRAVRNVINASVVEFLAKKDKIDVTTRAVDGKYALFCNVNVSNPSYDSQTKDCLTTPVEKFSKDESLSFDVPASVVDKVLKSELIELMRDWYKQKSAAEDQKTLRKLNSEAKKGLKRPDKYVPANTKIKSNRQLWVFEGDSAATGFRVARDPQTQGAYLMRGVPMNALGMTPMQIMKNAVFNDLISILGLQFGSDFDVSKMNYGKIVIATDGDVDGDKIAGLLLLFFATNWPELVDKHIICRSMSPIIIANKGKNKEVFYKLEDFRSQQNKFKGWQIRYTKGLGGLGKEDYKDMMRTPKLLYFKRDQMADTMFRKWFGKDADTRKELMGDTVK